MTTENLLAVDSTSAEWQALSRFIQARISELIDECCSPDVEDRRRRDCAVRIDELKSLLAAPAEAKRMTEHRLADDGSKLPGFKDGRVY